MQIYTALVSHFGVNVTRSLRFESSQPSFNLYREENWTPSQEQYILKLTNFNDGFLELVATLGKTWEKARSCFA